MIPITFHLRLAQLSVHYCTTIKICSRGKRSSKRRIKEKVTGPHTGIAEAGVVAVATTAVAEKAVPGEVPGAKTPDAVGEVLAAAAEGTKVTKVVFVEKAKTHQGTSRKKCASIIGSRT